MSLNPGYIFSLLLPPQTREYLNILFPPVWSPLNPKKVVLTDIQLTIPAGYLASISAVAHPSPWYHLVFPGVLDPAYAGDLLLLVGNFTNSTFLLDPKVLIAYFQLLSINDVVSLTSCDSLQDMGVLNVNILTALPAISEDLAPDEHLAALPPWRICEFIIYRNLWFHITQRHPASTWFRRHSPLISSTLSQIKGQRSIGGYWA